MRFIFAFFLIISVMKNPNAQDTAPKVEASKIKANIYFISGPGGNIALLCGEDGNLMIDDKFANITAAINTAVESVCKGGVKYVLNTHWHFDHTGGNENFGLNGSIIVAHDNVRQRMSKPGFIKFFKRKTEPSPKSALPVITFTKDMVFHLNNETVEFFHLGKGHTDGDGIVYFKQANIIHMGDLYFAGMYPFIDYSSGGSIEGMIKVVGAAIKKMNDDTIVVPGHGPLSNKKKLQNYRAMLTGIRDKRDALLKQGKSKQAIIDANITKAFDPKWNTGFIKGNQFVGLILEGK